MIRKILVIGLWVVAIGLWTPIVMSKSPNPYQELYDEVLAPVVKITCPNGVGSGVVIGSRVNGLMSLGETYVLTAAHVVGDEREVQVIVYSYHQDSFASCLRAFVVMTDTNKDLALLRFNQRNLHNPRLRSAKLAPRDYVPHLFTPIYAVGCSLGLNPRPSEGIITAERQWSPNPAGIRDGSHWEVSAPVLPGNSGGGVFLKDTPASSAGRHELIGIVVWVRVYHGQLVTTMAGVVPISEIYDFLDSTDSPRSLISKTEDFWGQGLRCRSVAGIVPINQIYEFLSVVPQGGLGADLTRWSDRGSECAIGIRGPGWLTLLNVAPKESDWRGSIRKRPKGVPKCNPLGKQHSGGGELKWQP